MNNCPVCGNKIPEDSAKEFCPYCSLSEALLNPSKNKTALEAISFKDILFCLLAIQLDLVQLDEFTNAVNHWAQEPDTSLSEKLQEQASLPEIEMDFLRNLTESYLDSDNTEFNLEEIGIKSAHDVDSDKSFIKSGLRKISELFLDDSKTLMETPGRYTKKREHSKGGMGRILLVHDEFLSRDIALKELLPEKLSLDPEKSPENTPFQDTSKAIARFLREGKLTSQLEHPNIVPVYEIGQNESGSFYYTMKFIRGYTLSKILGEKHGLDERLELLPNFLDTCKAVAYAHDRNVIHRDLKPGNIMVGSFGETVIIDWGLGKIVGESGASGKDPLTEAEYLLDQELIDDSSTQSGVRLGTPAYMSPEQARGQIDLIDQRSDVFNLGAILYEILTGDTPFGKLPTEVQIQNIASFQVPSPEKFSKGLPVELITICRKAIEFSPNDRYKDAGELLADIQQYISGALVATHVYSFKEKLIHFYKSNRAPVNVAVFSALVFAVFTIFSFIQIYKERNTAIHAQYLAEKTGYYNGVMLAETHIEDANFKEVSKVLGLTSEKFRSWEWDHINNIVNTQVLFLNEQTAADWIPGTNKIVSHSLGGILKITDCGMNAEIASFNTGVKRINDLAVNKDGTLAALAESLYVDLIDLKTGKLSSRIKGHTSNVLGVYFSPVNDLMASFSRNECIISASSTGNAKWKLFQPGKLIDLKGFSSNGKYLYGNYYEGSSARNSEFSTAWVVAAETGEILLDKVGAIIDILTSENKVYVYTDNKVNVYNLHSGKSISSFEIPCSKISTAVVDKENSRIIAACEDGVIFIWDLLLNQLVSESYDNETVRVLKLENKSLLSIPWVGGNLTLLNAENLSIKKEIDNYSRYIFDGSFSPSGNYFYTISEPHTLTVFSTEEIGVSRTIKDFNVAGIESPMTVSGDNAAVNLANGLNVVFNWRNGEIKGQIQGNPFQNLQIPALSTSNKFLVYAADIFTPAVYSLDNARITGLFKEHNSPLFFINSYSFDKVVTASENGEFLVWNPETFEIQHRLELNGAKLSAIAVSSYSDNILTAQDDGSVNLWKPDDDSLESLDIDLGGVITHAFCYSVDSFLVATDNSNLSLINLNVQTHPPVTWQYTNDIISLGKLNDDRILTSTWSDGLAIWETDQNMILTHLLSPSDHGTVLNFHYDKPSDTLVTMHSDGLLNHFYGNKQAVRLSLQKYEDTEADSQTVKGLVSTQDLQHVIEHLNSLKEVRARVNTENSLKWLGLSEGDTILKINNIKVDSDTEVLDLLTSELLLSNWEKVSVTILRKKLIYEYRWESIKREQTEKIVELDSKVFLSAIQMFLDILHSDLLEHNASNIQLQHLWGNTGGILGRNGIVLETAGFEQQHYLEELGLSNLDRLFSISNSNFTSVTELVKHLEEVHKHISDKTADKFEIEILRGAFRKISITYKIF